MRINLPKQIQSYHRQNLSGVVLVLKEQIPIRKIYPNQYRIYQKMFILTGQFIFRWFQHWFSVLFLLPRFTRKYIQKYRVDFECKKIDQKSTFSKFADFSGLFYVKTELNEHRQLCPQTDADRHTLQAQTDCRRPWLFNSG